MPADVIVPELVDTHVHLQWPTLYADLSAVLDRARDVGVRRMLTLATDVESSRLAVQLAGEHTDVFAAVGIHPGDVRGPVDDELGALQTLAESERVVAIGEIGLDYYHGENAPRSVQWRACEQQLDLAVACGKPVCIHNREATDDIMAILTGYQGKITPILHCFTGDRRTAHVALDLGCYVSFAGNVTYPSASELRDVAAYVPAERLLLETDAPFLAPQGYRGKRNEPSFVQKIYETVAAVRGTCVAELAATVSENAERLFSWSSEGRA